MTVSTPREGSISGLVDELARVPSQDPLLPVGLMFELIATDRPAVRVRDRSVAPVELGG